MTIRLLTNDMFEWNERRYRLVHVDTQLKVVHVIPLDGKSDPVCWKLAALTAMCSDRKNFRLLLDDAAPHPVDPSPSDVEVRNKRWSRIESLVKHPDLWDKGKRPTLLKEHASKIKVSTKTLRANLRAWWAGGQIEDALLGDYHRSGRIEESTPGALTVTEKSPNGAFTIVFAPAKQHARGRRPKDGTHLPFPIPAALREELLKAAREHFEEDFSKSVKGATTAVLAQFFALRGPDGKFLRDDEGAAVLRPPGQRPSYKQIKYLLNKALVVSAAFKRRNSAAEYENNHAPSTGSVLDDTNGPGDVFEIDGTVLDVYVVAKANRKYVIGKPALFLVIDRSSRLIVGFYLTLENPSWTEATQAILSISGDWKSLCERLKVPYKASDWPAAGVMPARFFGDRADMITYESNALCDGVGVSVTNAPALMSADKAIVESGFKSIQAPLRQHAPGYEPPVNIGKRRGKKYHKGASMTLDEMAAVLLRVIIAHNRKEKAGYQASPEEILGDHSSAPIHIWQRAVEVRMGTTRRMPIELLRRKLMPRGKAQVKKDGLHFLGCVYEADGLREWFTRASMRGTFEVVVSYTTNLVDSVVVHDRFAPGKEHTATLTRKSSLFRGYTFAEVAFVQSVAAAKVRTGERNNEGHEVALLQDMQEVTQPALAETLQLTVNVTPGMRLTDGDKLRALEAKDRRREVQGFDSPGLHYAQIQESIAVEQFEDVPDFDDVEVRREPSHSEAQATDAESASPQTSSAILPNPDALSALHLMLGIK